MEYQDLSSVGSSEALLNYQITEQKTDVKPLHVHLKDQHQVVFDEHQETEAYDYENRGT